MDPQAACWLEPLSGRVPWMRQGSLELNAHQLQEKRLLADLLEEVLPEASTE